MSIFLLLIGLLLGAWFILRWHRLQRSLRWWYRQHVLRLFTEAEAVRNGVLQDAFTLRRTLELAAVQTSATADEEFLLTTLDAVHHSLQRFSDFLSPAYLEDSFPLALDHLFHTYQQQHPDIALDISLSKDWQPTAYEQNRVVWMAIDELLRLALRPSAQSITACLTQHHHRRELIIKILYCQKPQDEIIELTHLRRSAQFLTAGTCVCQQAGERLVWSICWS